MRTLNARATRGRLTAGNLRLPCAVGRGGWRVRKREGDGATPAGRWPIRLVFYRRDAGVRPAVACKLRPITRRDAWCDVAGDRNYNRLVRLPYPVLDEQLWRGDHLYDLCAVLGYNDRPRVANNGSAIFMHLAREGYRPTAGCVALSKRDMTRLLAVLRPGASIAVAPHIRPRPLRSG